MLTCPENRGRRGLEDQCDVCVVLVYPSVRRRMSHPALPALPTATEEEPVQCPGPQKGGPPCEPTRPNRLWPVCCVHSLCPPPHGPWSHQGFLQGPP
ncbi:hypothetical protein NHX12_032185 [Muraenolepis orangiensis]|uniref:Uncharacterized protein n=1 Tax=Muraenolepis orangiensis TaxID=630683 RepID=A0A9Q0II03_9TELE|nr:hypothetical protein NHX12_032185 [Muraenolepis orangiensis]